MAADRTACRAALPSQVASRAVTALLIVLAVGFAWSIGAHYTGAVMGMPHALRAIGAWQALLLMAPLAFLGATFASHEVEKRVGSGLTETRLSVSQQVVVIGVAFAVTTFFNRFRMPTSTIQILVFSVVGGAGIALGVLTWGKPLLRRVAFEIVEVDRAMATAAQLVQAGVVLAAVAFGFFTSMNQALVGAMAGAGFARGRETVHLSTLLAILQGWVLGPAASIAAGYVFGLLVR